MFLEISQDSQENTSTRVSFLVKLQASGREISKSTFFTEHLLATASLFHQNKFFLVEFRSQSALSLTTCAFYLNGVLVLVLFHVIYITHIHILCLAFLECFTTSLHIFSPYSTVTVLTWRNTSVFMSQLHTSMNNIIVEWIVTATSTVTTYPIVIPIIIIHISALMQFMLKQKT